MVGTVIPENPIIMMLKPTFNIRFNHDLANKSIMIKHKIIIVTKYSNSIVTVGQL